jgi:magnesium-transporting ATPase (P-type)
MAGQRLAQRNVLVKKLSVIEALGTVSTICTDKSGTLTQNQMTVREIWSGGGRWRVTGGGYEPKGEIVPANGSNPIDVLRSLSAAMLCNNSPQHSRYQQPVGRRLATTEEAMQVAASRGFLKDLNQVLPRVHELPLKPGANG